jgi:outer membrane protein TolC
MALKYSEDILNAVREVETALNADANLKKQIRNQESSVSSLRRAEKIARGRYEDGIQSLQNYLDTQQRRYVTEQSLYRLYQTQWNNRIALYLALGGDWFTGGTPSKNCNNKVS